MTEAPGETIRAARPADHAAIDALLAAAFPTDAEARLVRALREDGAALLELVAEAGGGIVGHVLFSAMAAPPAAVALAPVATAAAFRRRGVADRLIREGLTLLPAKGAALAVVLGDPAYYRRFGFSAEAAAGFDCIYAGPYLMALALAEDAPTSGALAYPNAFASL